MSRKEEQRDFHRMRIDAQARVIYTHGDEMKQVTARCQDLSATGLSVILEDKLSEGDTIEVVIEGKQIMPLDAKARVLRINEDTQGWFVHGCSITSLR